MMHCALFKILEESEKYALIKYLEQRERQNALVKLGAGADSALIDYIEGTVWKFEKSSLQKLAQQINSTSQADNEEQLRRWAQAQIEELCYLASLELVDIAPAKLNFKAGERGDQGDSHPRQSNQGSYADSIF